MHAHHVAAAVPVVEVADDADARCVGRPDREAGARDAGNGADPGAQFFINLLVRAFAEQVQVEVAEGLRETIRVFDIPGLPAAAQPQPVMPQPRRHDRGEQAFRMYALHAGQRTAVGIDEFDAVGVRLKRADNPVVTDLVHAEHAERVVMPSRNECRERLAMVLLVSFKRRHRVSRWSRVQTFPR